MRDAFFFDRMLTPHIITFVYWILLVVVVITGLYNMFGDAGIGFVGGLLGVVLGLVFVRIWCELLIVLFKMNDNLKKIAGRE